MTAVVTSIPGGNAPEKDSLSITPLGCGAEVGRSCVLIKFKGRTLMLDCGVHPAYTGLASLPYLDDVDPAEVDMLLVSHFHLDHAAAVPYFMEKTGFRGRVFMTHPTKAIYKWMLSDFVRVSNVSTDDMLFDEKDLLKSYERIETVDFHQEVEVEGVRFTCFNAGHVLGAAQFLIEIAGVKILYTGDYSREEDRHLMAAEVPQGIQPDIMIAESTYGVQNHGPRLQREARFTSLVHEIINRGGRCLIPIFALGRTQELLLILDEYWQANPSLHHIPIYYASNLARKCMTVYQTYINMMNAKIKRQFAIANPFIFRHISNLKSMQAFHDDGPCVMMASPAMLQSGLSRELFDKWCSDKRNGVIIPGYVVEGTLAKHILTEPSEVQSLSGTKMPLRMSVDYISFSAHADYTQAREFIEEINPKNLVLVHGEQNVMHRFKVALKHGFYESQRSCDIFNPRNTESVNLFFKGEKTAKTVGSLARTVPLPNAPLRGILVQKDFHYHLMNPEDLINFGDLATTEIYHRQHIRFPHTATIELLLINLERMYFDGITMSETGEISVMDIVRIRMKDEKGKELIVEWEGNHFNDMVADSVMCIILALEVTPFSVKATTHPHHHVDEKPQMARLIEPGAVAKGSDGSDAKMEDIEEPRHPSLQGAEAVKAKFMSSPGDGSISLSNAERGDPSTKPESSVSVAEKARWQDLHAMALQFFSNSFPIVELDSSKSRIIIQNEVEIDLETWKCRNVAENDSGLQQAVQSMILRFAGSVGNIFGCSWQLV